MITSHAAGNLQALIDKQGYVLLDGGLASELEKRGQDLKDPLWSAKLLQENPEAIYQVHLDYLRAGAQCLTTASYQATFQGFAKRGFSDETAKTLLLRSIVLAEKAREAYRLETMQTNQSCFIAASIGPYGAYLADGSEYRGHYALSEKELQKFHAQRFAVLMESSADLIAFETIPCLKEMRALFALLESAPQKPAWFAFACRNESELVSGEKIADAVHMLDLSSAVFAVGVNCTKPEFITPLIKLIKGLTSKPLIVYPNSGEHWNPQKHEWEGSSDPHSLAHWAQQWLKSGAVMIGGCCRTTPEHIRQIARQFSENST